MLIPLIIGGAAITAYFLYRFFRKKKQNKTEQERKQEEQEQNDEPDRSSFQQMIEGLRNLLQKGMISGTGQGERLPEKYDPLTDLWNQIKKIVSEVNFFEKKISVQRKVGEEKRTSNIPTGEIEITNMQRISQLPQALTGSLGHDDDVFYAKVANNDILISQHIEHVGIYEEQFLKRRKKLRVVVDISGSTKGERNAWERIMCDLFIKKAKDSGAELVISTFADRPMYSQEAVPETPQTYTIMHRFVDSKVQADGNTDIDAALFRQIEEIEKENEELEAKQDTQIVLITDGTQGINEEFISTKLKEQKTTLHTVVLGTHHEQLKRVSTKYHYLDVPGQ